MHRSTHPTPSDTAARDAAVAGSACPEELRRERRRVAAWAAGLVLARGLGAPVAAAQPAPAGERRIALVIGNADYAKAPLKFPEADAQLMAATLRELRFAVSERFNLARREFHQALDEFLAQIRTDRPGTAALVYYAGHGVQLEGLNYLVPTDRALQTNAEVRDYGIPATRLVRQVGEANPMGVNVVILDACRNNPFVRSRSAARGPPGLAPVDSPRGVLVAYSTDPDKPALDGGSRNGRNSVYTEALVEQMKAPGVPIETVFKRVRVAVADATQGRQTPWENTSLRGDFYLAPRG
jgi:uncharacterized caspase-like protein